MKMTVKQRNRPSPEFWLTAAITATVCWLVIAADYYLPCLCGSYRHPFLRNILIGVYPVVGYVSASLAGARSELGTIRKRAAVFLVFTNLFANALNVVWFIAEVWRDRCPENAGPWLFAFAATALVLTGCGFHPRGQMNFASQISSLQLRGPIALMDELAVLLESNGIAVASDGQSAVLIVEKELLDKQILSVDSRSGKEREHSLAYTVAYRILSAEGKELLTQQTVNIVRDYVLDEEAILGKDQERTVLQQEMRRSAASQILRRLSAWRAP